MFSLDPRCHGLSGVTEVDLDAGVHTELDVFAGCLYLGTPTLLRGGLRRGRLTGGYSPDLSSGGRLVDVTDA